MMPHPEKEFKGGEDASAASQLMIAVADGVGGWAESGVDPALYSK
jgi:protein phosphatase PTC7